MSHPFFDEDEHISGSNELCVKLSFSHVNLNIFLVMKLPMVTNDKSGGVAADDVMKTISSNYETKIFTNLGEFPTALTKEDSFVPNGNVLNELSNGNIDYQQHNDDQSDEQHLQLYQAAESTPDLDCHEQMQSLYRHAQDLLKRTRRAQVQQKHRNLTKQMKVFVSQQQKFSSVTCQRFNDKCNVSQNGIGQENKDKLLSTIDSLRYNLRHLESKYDSDATESSSGGESCDEYEESNYRSSTFSVPEGQSSTLPSTSSSSTSNLNRHLPIRSRSSWKWCTERSAIASRWSWLQAQVSDLETKLRQQNDIFRHLRATKGSIYFGEDNQSRRHFPSSSSINASHINNNNNNGSSSSNSNHQASPALPPPPPSSSSSSSISPGNNNLVDTPTLPDDAVPPSSNSENAQQQPQQEIATLPGEAEEATDEESTCMRAIPYISMKRRKLVRLESTLSVAVKKAIKYSSIQCSCNIYPPYVPPCVICTGRYSYMHSIDTEFMPYYERVSLLDSACHPVLCLPNDVPLGIHFTQFLKRENIHSKPVLLRNSKKKKLNNILGTASGSGLSTDQKTKKLTASNSITKSKKKLDKSKKRRLSTDSLKKTRERLSSGCSSRAESPIPSPCPSETSSNGGSNLTPLLTPTTPSAPLQRRRRSEQHAFDINNIVIPYSIAAANRIEKLQYKEIITPKWRINEEFSIPPPENIKRQIINGNAEGNSQQEEDISQCAFEVRHGKCEESERQRILSYYLGLTKNQNPRKGTARVRFESKSDSNSENPIHDSGSASKGKSKANSNHNDSGYERKRNFSFSRFSIRDDSLDEEFRPFVPPFELRQFPLPESEYDLMLQVSTLEEEKEALLYRARRDSAKNSIDHLDSNDEGTHASNSIASSPDNMDVDMIDDDAGATKSDLYNEEDGCGLPAGEKDNDPEWKPS